MTNPNHSERELKFDASKVEKNSFIAWCKQQEHIRYLYVVGPDTYYRQGDHAVRHRHSETKSDIGNAGQLTVKRRKSHGSIMDRVEVDLEFADHIEVADVTAFLLASGWKKEFTLLKAAHIFWFERKGIEVTVVVYEVGKVMGEFQSKSPLISNKLVNKRLFLEIETEKSNKLNSTEAKAELNWWHNTIAKSFTIGEPLNSSLYEIYSGKKYKVMSKKKK